MALWSQAMSTTTAPRLHPLNQDFVWQDASREGLRALSPEQVDAFNRDGFFVYRGAFTADEIAAVTAAIDPLEQAHVDFVNQKPGGRFRLTVTESISFTIHIAGKSPALAAFAAHPAIRDICHDLIGPDVRLYWDQSVYKKTEKPQEFPWHQDNGYTFVEPQQYLTLWIPLVDVDEQNGCPWIAPGLHKLGTLEHWVGEAGRICLEDVQGAVPAPAKAGDIVVFSSLAPHRTGPNLTDQVRKAYILQYAPAGAYVKLPDGTVVTQDDPARQFRILDGEAT